MFAKRFRNNSWILYDVYKIAPHFPLEISIYGYLFNENNTMNVENAIYQTAETQRIRISDKFSSKSVRNDLKGLKLRCGLGVCEILIAKKFLITFPHFNYVYSKILLDCLSWEIYVFRRSESWTCRYFLQRDCFCCGKYERKFKYEVNNSHFQ